MVWRFQSSTILILFGGFMLLCLISLCKVGSAETITVDDDAAPGEVDYVRIQWAVDNATEGDTIRVFEGYYLENLLINTSIKLIGNSSDTTYIFSVSSSRVVSILADSVTVQGFGLHPSNSKYGTGIYVESNSNRILENNCSNNYYGIRFESSQYNLIQGNTLSHDVGYAIRLVRSSNNTISNNTILVSEYGISLSYSQNNTLAGNRMMSGGISISGDSVEFYNSNIITNSNILQGKPIILLKDSHDSIAPPNAAQMIIVNCTNITIRDQYFTNGSYGIKIAFSSKINIENSTCSFGLYGAYLYNSQECTIKDSISSYNERPGISLYYSHNNTFSSNVCEFNSLGMSLLRSHGNVISESRLNNNYRGIYLQYSDNNSCIRNECINTFVGISLRYAENNIIQRNNCSNTKNGIELDDSHFNHIWKNVCTHNDEYGIYIQDSETNTFEFNNCSFNGKDGIYVHYPYQVQNMTFTGNSCSYNGESGIRIGYDGANATLTSNICNNNNGSGIYLAGDYHRVVNNTCNSNNIGILLFMFDQSIISYNGFSWNDIGIRFEMGINNSFTNNSIEYNRIGLLVDSACRSNNTAYYNSIHGNDEAIGFYGSLFFIPLDARYNYWGDTSGPYHTPNNTKGKGNSVPDRVMFEPWLDALGNEHYLPEPDDDPNFLGLGFLIMILAALLLLLGAIVQMSDEIFQRTVYDFIRKQGFRHSFRTNPPTASSFSKKPLSSSDHTSTPYPAQEIVITCNNCGGTIPSPVILPIRLTCPKCGKEILNNRFR